MGTHSPSFEGGRSYINFRASAGRVVSSPFSLVSSVVYFCQPDLWMLTLWFGGAPVLPDWSLGWLQLWPSELPCPSAFPPLLSFLAPRDALSDYPSYAPVVPHVLSGAPSRAPLSPFHGTLNMKHLQDHPCLPVRPHGLGYLSVHTDDFS